MNNSWVIIPNRYSDVVLPLTISLLKHEPDTRTIVIVDGPEKRWFPNNFKVMPYTSDKFQFAESVNIGINWVIKNTFVGDIILLNDDCVMLDDYPLTRLQEFAQQYPTVGILSPLIRGCVGNVAQRYHEKAKWWKPYETIKLIWDPEPVCFPCVYLRRGMIEQIGYLDETIKGYGYDDDEYCKRARRLGWLTAVTSTIVVQHGDGGRELGEGRGKTWSVSFAKRDKECKSAG